MRLIIRKVYSNDEVQGKSQIDENTSILFFMLYKNTKYPLNNMKILFWWPKVPKNSQSSANMISNQLKTPQSYSLYNL